MNSSVLCLLVSQSLGLLSGLDLEWWAQLDENQHDEDNYCTKSYSHSQ